MAKRGGQKGNLNGVKNKPWADALARALARLEVDGVPQGQALNKLAETVVLRALAGDKDAWTEIGNRLDGKPAQAIEGTDGGPVVVKILRCA